MEGLPVGRPFFFAVATVLPGHLPARLDRSVLPKLVNPLAIVSAS
jgi:hypothetical protein